MALEDYRRKRDFRKTAEPAGGHLRIEDHPMEYRAFAGVIPKSAEAMKALLDGEIVSLKENRAASFEALQQALGALHVGYYEKPGGDRLLYAGKVGIGFTDPLLASLHKRLRDLGLESFLKTTGGKGLHVVAPIRRGPDWDEGVRSDQFNSSILPRRLESQKNNPWVEIGTLRQGITAGAKRKIGMRG